MSQFNDADFDIEITEKYEEYNSRPINTDEEMAARAQFALGLGLFIGLVIVGGFGAIVATVVHAIVTKS